MTIVDEDAFKSGDNLKNGVDYRDERGEWPVM